MKKGKKLSLEIYEISFQRLPKAFDGLKIINISDLHNANLKGAIETQLNEVKPDMIVITGDLISFENYYQNAMKVVEYAVKLAPVFYVNGNHEGRFSKEKYLEFTSRLKRTGVVVLENQIYHYNRGGEKIAIIGMNDPKFFVGKKKEMFKKTLKELILSVKDEFKLLLSHRPEFFKVYAECGVEIALSGHVHGGQIRLPKIGAFYAPGQGLFPKYADGLKRINDSYMMISRGIGRTFRTPPRILNPRELSLIILKKLD